jgi:hypothetical protein
MNLDTISLPLVGKAKKSQQELGLGLGFNLLMSFVSEALVLVLSKLFFGFWEMIDARDERGLWSFVREENCWIAELGSNLLGEPARFFPYFSPNWPVQEK